MFYNDKVAVACEIYR